MNDKKCIIYLGNRLQKKGLNPTTVDTLGDKLMNDVRIIRASHIGHPVLRLIHMWWTVLRYAQNADYLLIDTYSTNAFTYAWTSAKIAKALGLKYIPFLHGGDLPIRYQKDREKCLSFFNNAYKIISPSGYLKLETETAFDVAVDVIPNYLEFENYPFNHRSKVGEVKLLWVRAFHEIYNPTLAPKVLAKLREMGVESQMTMVGPDKDGSMEKTKKVANELGVKITFTGRLPKADWLALSADFHIFVNTTNANNTPVSVMEAMALGMPVVTTNVGGIPYLFENGKEGIQVPADDETAMADAIYSLQNDEYKLAEISANARQKAESWSWMEVRKLWLNLLVNAP